MMSDKNIDDAGYTITSLVSIPPGMMSDEGVEEPEDPPRAVSIPPGMMSDSPPSSSPGSPTARFYSSRNDERPEGKVAGQGWAEAGRGRGFCSSPAVVLRRRSDGVCSRNVRLVRGTETFWPS